MTGRLQNKNKVQMTISPAQFSDVRVYLPRLGLGLLFDLRLPAQSGVTKRAY